MKEVGELCEICTMSLLQQLSFQVLQNIEVS